MSSFLSPVAPTFQRMSSSKNKRSLVHNALHIVVLSAVKDKKTDPQKEFLQRFVLNLRSSPPEVFLGKGVLNICSKFTGKHPCRTAISIKLQGNFIEIELRHGCSPVNLLHIFRTPFPTNISKGLLLIFL